ncbi:MAG: Asp-tRNA(Asn)/Glu-tRNA(Gln) amidotransferase subunit GatA [Chitinophagales bacterium]|nr:Asp-tRNA(Asn)/Glu-tRNA(Gln) amidotransferase subunit GatA [Chitinophagales bacterium]
MFREALSQKQISCTKMVQHFLQRIEKNKDLNAFVEVFANEALAKAQKIDAEIDAGMPLQALTGMVLGIKDVIAYQQHRLGAASKMLENFTSLYTATALQRLLDAGAIVIGRLNCDEFAMGSTNEHSVYGAVKNALDNTKVAGGSSGGSAVAVQANLCHVALGSDTGGSVRQPASFCGIVGCKPTYGRISRHGLVAYASSFDQIGTLSHNIRDAAVVLETMMGSDDFDATASSQEVSNFSTKLPQQNSGKRLAYCPQMLENKGLNKNIRQQFYTLLDTLEKQGFAIKKVNFPEFDYLVPTYYVLTAAEASSNLGRYTGLLYGYRSKNGDTLDEIYRNSRSEGFGKEVKRRILLGTFVLSAGYYDAYFNKAQQIRQRIAQRTQEILSENDFLLMPTTPDAAFNLGELPSQSPVEMYLADIFTVQANLAGVPAISIPAFHNEENKLPVGLQVLSEPFSEEKLLQFGHFLMEESRRV